MTGYNFIDLIIFLIFLSSMLVGFGRGFVSEVISLGTLIAAVIIATMFSNSLANYLMHTSSVQSMLASASSSGVAAEKSAAYVALGVSFFILFAGTALVGTIIGYILNAAFAVTLLGIGNRILGAAFGLARGYIINLVLIFVIQLSPFASQPLWQQSRLVAAYQPAIQWLGSLVSPALANLKERFGQQIQDVTSGIKGYIQ